MGRVVCFGELLLRLEPEGYNRFLQADKMNVVFGGSEANVAEQLAIFGDEASFVTKLPENDIAQAAVNSVRRFGVDTSNILRGGPRMGLYYLEKGASQRSSKVIYDRAGSSFAESSPDEYDWDSILNGADWLHISGITPALSDNLAETAVTAMKKAKEKGITVSFDPNYRSNLWPKEKARRVLPDMMKYVDVCIANEGAAADCFNMTAPEAMAKSGNGAAAVAFMIGDKFNIPYVAMTKRTSTSANVNDFSAMLYVKRAKEKQGSVYESRQYRMQIVDRVGGGDAFAAGLIYAIRHDMPFEKGIEFAVATAVLKHTVEGDTGLASVSETMDVAENGGNGMIRR